MIREIGVNVTCNQWNKWNESGFMPPLCTYRLNWARRTSWGWWDDWDDTVLQTQDSKFEPWRSEAEHATSRSRRLPTILTFTRGWWRNNFVSVISESMVRIILGALGLSGLEHYGLPLCMSVPSGNVKSGWVSETSDLQDKLSALTFLYSGI